MQNTPTPYQRSRRAARPAAEEAAGIPAPQREAGAVRPGDAAAAAPAAMPPRTSYNAGQYGPRRPDAAPQRPVQQPRYAYPQQVRPQAAAPQQTRPAQAPAAQPARPAPQQSAYPYAARPAQRVPLQAADIPSQPDASALHAAPSGNRRPRSLQQQPAASSGWNMPSASAGYAQPPRPAPAGERPRAAGGRPELSGGIQPGSRRPVAAPEAVDPSRRGEPRRKNSAESARPVDCEKPRTPGWLLTALSLSLIGVMALVAANFLMQAYLKTDADERQAAYESILYNYHVTEQADGTLRVTWQDLIEKYAEQYNLEPAFVTAVIRNESSFRTAAESSVGARGLMQMMPDTAEWIAGKLNDPFDFDKLYSAETSIRYGCWYLNYLSELFRGDPVLVCAAYHAGQGEVWGWLGNPAISPDGVTVPIQNIPISNTKTYAGRVTQAYGIYQTLLYPQEPSAASSLSMPDARSAAGAVHAAAAQ